LGIARLRRLGFAVLDRAPSSLVARLGAQPWLKRVLRPLVNRAVPATTTIATVRGGGARGLRLLVDPQAEKFYWTGDHEPHLQEALRAELRPGMCFWDVGCHIGFFALQAARLVGPAGSVLAFEPMPDNQERLRRNIGFNDSDVVTVIPKAVAARRGSMTMYARGSCASSLMWTLNASLQDVESRPVEVTTLDEMVEVHGMPDLVKIDAEGTEVDVLRGASRLIAARVPFLVEFMDAAGLLEAKRFMPGYGFKLLADNHYAARAAAQNGRPGATSRARL